MSFKGLEPKPLTIYNWGDGVFDLRYFTPQILMPTELQGFKDAKGYVPSAYDLDGAVESLKLTLKGATPGIYFAGNPLENTYGKWCVALKKAGWHQVPGCALNRVWGNWEAYKGPGSKNGPGPFSKNAWDSPDGFRKWIHAFYMIVPGRKKAISMDFTSKTRNLQAHNGDADLAGPGSKGSLWHINYGGSQTMLAKYTKKDYGPAWCKNYARLSKSCGVALGQGIPDCGADLDEEFFCIGALPLDEKWPKGWSQFLEYGGHSWATNLPKIPGTSQATCPHEMTV